MVFEGTFWYTLSAVAVIEDLLAPKLLRRCKIITFVQFLFALYTV